MNFDLVINGGGLVGATLACTLGHHKLKVALLDKTPLPSNRENAKARALALSETSVRCLTSLEIWPLIQEQACPILEVHVSKQGAFGVSKINAQDLQLAALGYVVDADFLNTVLNTHLKNFPNITVFRPDQIEALECLESGWSITLHSKKTLKAKLMVAADGADSELRTQQGIGVQVVDHNQTALVVNCELAHSHYNIAYERFTSNGSIAMLPFGENRVKCVWALPSQEAKSQESLSDEALLDNIQKVFGYRLGHLQALKDRSNYPLRSICANTLYGDRLVLIGNAANTLHPVAAQGFNLGLRDAATLAEKILLAKEANQDIGSIDILRDYANARRTDHENVRRMTQCLADPKPLQCLGIYAAEWLPPFKRLVAERGLGRQADLPQLCRGLKLATSFKSF